MHCDECEEHDLTLLAHTPETISLEELGDPGCDPICFVSDQGFRYFMPGLVRLTLEQTENFFDTFLGHLDPQRIGTFDFEQTQAILGLLEYLRDSTDFGEHHGHNQKVLDRKIRRLAKRCKGFGT